MKYFIYPVVLFVLVLLLPNISYAQTGTDEKSSGTDRVIVEVLNEDGQEEIESLTWDELDKIEDVQQVEVLEPDYIRSIGVVNSNIAMNPTWSAKRIGVEQMMEQLISKKNDVIVAIIDTGVDKTHPLLADRVIEGYDFVDNDSDPMDKHMHGTHVAGIIAQSTPQHVKVLPIRSLDADGNGYDTNIAKGIHYAVDNGASVINMSLAGENYSTYLANAIEYAIQHDVLIVVASGNKGMDTEKFYPASEQRVIVVSATDQNDKVADFSNTGASIDIAAPGVSILSSIPGGKYALMDGTSMAAPHISAVASMLKLDDPTRTIREIEDLLKRYADDKGAKNWDSLYGEGIVNVSSYQKYSIIQQKLASADYIALPKSTNVPLDKKWTINFNRILTDTKIISVFMYSDEKEVPIKVSFTRGTDKLMVTPEANFEANSSYLLDIRVAGGERYMMSFQTALVED